MGKVTVHVSIIVSVLQRAGDELKIAGDEKVSGDSLHHGDIGP